MTTQVLTSAPTVTDEFVVSAYINKKTAQVITVTYDENPHDDENYFMFESNIWTFSRNYPSPCKPQGYDGDTENFAEALGYVLGIDQESYKEDIARIRAQYVDTDGFFNHLYLLASEKGIWLRPVSAYETSRGNVVYELGTLSGWSNACIGFAWNTYDDISKSLEWSSDYSQEWSKNVNYELAEFSRYVNGDCYSIEYVSEDSEQREEDGYLIYDNEYYFDPNDKEQVLSAAFMAFELPDNPEDWVKAEQQTVFVAQC